MSSSSIRRTDILALSNLRNDGRKNHEIRALRLRLGVVPAVSGSAVLEAGLTVAVATVQGPLPCHRRSDELADRAVLQVTFQQSGQSERRRTAHARHVQRALQSALLLHNFPRQRVVVTVTILVDDGSALCTAMNAVTLAVVDAGLPLTDWVCACTVTETGAVDANRKEGGDDCCLQVANLPQRGSLVWTVGNARRSDWDAVEASLAIGVDGCRAVFEVMQRETRRQLAIRLRAGRGEATVVSRKLESMAL